MTRILLVNARYHPGGVGGPARFVRILAERMARSGDDVLVACRGAVSRPLRQEIDGVAVHRLPLAMTEVQAAEALAGLLEREAPRAVHTNFLKGFDKPSLAEVLEGYPGRVVHTLHEYALLCTQGLLFRDGRVCAGVCPGCRPFAQAARRFAERVDAVVGVSRHVLDRHLRAGLFGGAPQQRVIPNSYDAPPGALQRPAPGPALRLGYLGRLSREKGLDHLLETLVGLGDEHHLELAVAGRVEGDYAQALRRRFEGPRIRFLGHTDPERFFPRIEVLVFPSLCEETFGRGVIEGLAHGVPAIVSDRGALPELIDAGRTGWVYCADDPQALRAALLAVSRCRQALPAMAAHCVGAAVAFATDRVLGEYRRLYTGSD